MKTVQLLCAAGAMVLAASFAVAQAPSPAPGAQPPRPPVSVTRDPAKVKSGLYTVEPDHLRVVWKVGHHGFSTFQALLPEGHGTLNLNVADISKSKVDITMDMAKVISGIPDFDGRLRGAPYFNVEKFPTATFRSTKIERTGEKTARITGDLTYLGVTKPVIMAATFRQAGQGLSNPPGYRIGFDLTTQIKRTDFSAIADTSDTAVGNLVDLEIEAEFMLKE